MRAETSKTKSMPRAAEMKILRIIKRVTLKDEIRCSVKRIELKVSDAVRLGRARRRYWRDYVSNVNYDRWVN